MASFGLKIAKVGKNVLNAINTELSFSSKSNNLKTQTSFLQGQKTGTVPKSGTYTFTINHNLGYIPAFELWYETETNIWRSCFSNVILGSSANIFTTSQNSNNIYADQAIVSVYIQNSSATTDYTIPIYYIIFVDEIR